MTNGDNSNIVVARVARETFEVERVVARIYDPRRAAIYERLGIPTVATVQWTTERVLRRILPDAHGVEWVDPSAKVCLVERTVPGALGRPAAAPSSRSPASPAWSASSRLGEAVAPRRRARSARTATCVWVSSRRRPSSTPSTPTSPAPPRPAGAH